MYSDEQVSELSWVTRDFGTNILNQICLSLTWVQWDPARLLGEQSRDIYWLYIDDWMIVLNNRAFDFETIPVKDLSDPEKLTYLKRKLDQYASKMIATETWSGEDHIGRERAMDLKRIIDQALDRHTNWKEYFEKALNSHLNTHARDGYVVLPLDIHTKALKAWIRWAWQKLYKHNAQPLEVAPPVM